MNIYEPCRVCDTLTLTTDNFNHENGKGKHTTTRVYCSENCKSFGTTYNSYPKERLQRKFKEKQHGENAIHSFIYGRSL